MISTTSKPEADRQIIDMAEFGARLAERRTAYEAEYGPIDDAKLRNAGKNRTESKRALLKAIGEFGGKW